MILDLYCHLFAICNIHLTSMLLNKRIYCVTKGVCSRFSSKLFSSIKPIGSFNVESLKNGHPNNNIVDSILSKVGKGLHLNDKHPLGIIKKRIEDYCNNYAETNGQIAFKTFDNLSPIVNVKSCFDDLNVKPDHVSRRPSDTYYVDDKTVLRTHTSAHQVEFISEGIPAFLVSGDVYRRDEVDASHYPVFHQMEGVRIFQPNELPVGASELEAKQVIEADLKRILTGLAVHLFGECEMRWREDFFPFTEPSFELEIFFNDKWLEVLGCGVVHRNVMANAGKADRYGWAFGLGLERLAMVLFAIPDIRLFWSEDERFTSQFKAGQISKFQSYSKYPPCTKDVSFWLPSGEDGKPLASFHINDVYELVRGVAGDIVESVVLMSEFTKPNGQHSQHYRIVYRDMGATLTNEVVNDLQGRVREELVRDLRVVLR